MKIDVSSSSFRDPDGFVFTHEGRLYRQVNLSYREHYDHLVSSGLYSTLEKAGVLISHAEADPSLSESPSAYKVLIPDLVPFISYPYEWCFSQLKDAALLVLSIQKTALEFGMSLKDASAYNVQFRGGKPVFIDTLSFEKLVEGRPWVAYRQFCQFFLAPLALMCYTDIRLCQLLRNHLDGLPLDLTSSLLPARTWLRLPLLLHIHLHARSQRHYADKPVKKSGMNMNPRALMSFIDNLMSITMSLKWSPSGTTWADYYDKTNYSPESLGDKMKLVGDFLDASGAREVWDLGANTGAFSRVASEKGVPSISFDMDPAAVEINYIECKKKGRTSILPLVLDLTNPSPAIGWENRERMSFLQRGPVDTVLALALIHHLAISNNLPLDRIAGFFANVCKWLVIEFVPKSDSQVQRLLSSREDIFSGYTQRAFEEVFSRYFTIEQSVRVKGTERTLYFMKKV